jgi:hypothetical protein
LADTQFGENNVVLLNLLNMKLIDLVNNIDSVDEESVIFQEDRENFSSDIILSYAEKGDGGIKEVKGKKYYYLIEVFLAKEFVNDWIGSLNYLPTETEIAKRLYDYAIKDA